MAKFLPNAAFLRSSSYSLAVMTLHCPGLCRGSGSSMLIMPEAQPDNRRTAERRTPSLQKTALRECRTKGLWLNDIEYQNENNSNKSVMTQSITNILIWLVRRYQAYCPSIIRKQCRFTPSCSEYMILAVKKYGPLHGTCKGIFRICRCLPFTGGEDYP